MTAITEEVAWTTESMIEVGLREPDDFLKVRETLTRIGEHPEKKRNYINHVTYCISRASTTSCISKSCLLWTERKQT